MTTSDYKRHRAHHARYASTWPAPLAVARPCAPSPLEIATPFGPFAATVTVDGVRPHEQPDSSALLPGGQLRRWRTASVAVDQVTAALPGPQGPTWVPLLGCVGLMWRVAAVADVARFEISTRLPLLPAGLAVSSNDGQYLDAVEVSDASTHLWIGGPGGDYLAEGWACGPKHWQEQFAPYLNYPDGIDWLRAPGSTVLRDGIAWSLPGLKAGESVFFEAAIAWQQPRDADVTGWFAVDVSWAAILDEALAPSLAVTMTRLDRTVSSSIDTADILGVIDDSRRGP